MIARGTGIQGQARLLNIVTRLARGDQPLDGWEEEALRAALRITVERAEGRAPVLADVLPNLGNIVGDAEYPALSATARDDLHKAGLSVKWTLNGLLDEYAGLLDGETSKTVDLHGKLTAFDISQLPDDGPAVPVVMAIGNMWMLGRLRSERDSATTVVYEEGWHMIGGPSAQLIKANQKLSRGLGISNVFVMHKGTDIPVTHQAWPSFRKHKPSSCTGNLGPKTPSGVSRPSGSPWKRPARSRPSATGTTSMNTGHTPKRMCNTFARHGNAPSPTPTRASPSATASKPWAAPK
jgi:hypothetical protein